MANVLKSTWKAGGKITGIIFVIVAAFVTFFHWHIFRETFEGRPPDEIDYSQLVFPTILFIIGFYLIFKKKKDE
jgi:hypothetical protein